MHRITGEAIEVPIIKYYQIEVILYSHSFQQLDPSPVLFYSDMHRCLQYKAPEYLVLDIPSLCHLQSATRHHLKRTMLPAQHFRSSSLLCRWSDCLELATGQSPRAGAQ